MLIIKMLITVLDGKCFVEVKEDLKPLDFGSCVRFLQQECVYCWIYFLKNIAIISLNRSLGAGYSKAS